MITLVYGVEATKWLNMNSPGFQPGVIDYQLINPALFETTTITLSDNTVKTIHQNTLDELQKEFNRSQEIFIN